MDNALTPLLVILGPTGSGKSRLGLEVAEQIGGEIVSADAFAVYRGLDIGTDKPSIEDRQRVPHHLVDVADPGLTTFAIGRQSLKIDTLQAAAVVDRLVDSLLAGSQVALVGAGTALVGDGSPGSPGSVAPGDQLSISAQPIIGFDFSIPQAGVSLDSSTAREGLDLDDPNANDIEARVDSAGALLRVTNSTPFGLQLDIVLVADSVADAFAEPNSESLTSIIVSPALVDGNGRVTEASRDTVFVGLTGASVRPFLGEWFTAGVLITLTPPAGGRGALHTTDLVIVDATAVMHLRVGGGQ